MSDDIALKMGRLEDRFALYEPLLGSLQGISSVSGEIDKIQTELGALRESRIEMRERLTTLFKAQTRVYEDTAKLLEEKTRSLERSMDDWPAQDILTRLNTLEQDIIFTRAFSDRLTAAEDVIDSFKLKGWDLMFRIIPWVIAASASSWVIFIKWGLDGSS